MWCLLAPSKHLQEYKSLLQSFKKFSECSKWTLIRISKKHCAFFIKTTLSFEGDRSVYQGISNGEVPFLSKKPVGPTKMFQDIAAFKLHFSYYQEKMVSVQLNVSHRRFSDTQRENWYGSHLKDTHPPHTHTHAHIRAHTHTIWDFWTSVTQFLHLPFSTNTFLI